MKLKNHSKNFLLIPSLAIIGLSLLVEPGNCAPIPDFMAFTTAERDFLTTNCPDVTQTISSGLVVAYGEVMRPPIFASTIYGSFYLNAVQILPKPKSAGDWLIRHRERQIESQYLAETISSPRDAISNTKAFVARMKESKKIDGFESKTGVKGSESLEISIESKKAPVLLDYPAALSEKNRFIVSALLREYDFKHDSDGKPKALIWLENMFSELVRIGVVKKFHRQLEPFEEDVMFIEFPHERWGGGHGFGDMEDGVPIAVIRKRWMAKEVSIQSERSEVIRRLQSGEAVVYSHAFERHGDYSSAISPLLESIRNDEGDKTSESSVKSILHLSNSEFDDFLKELR